MLHFFYKIQSNEALYILVKENDRKNARFREYYHTSCLSSRLDQRQTRESVLLWSRSDGLRNEWRIVAVRTERQEVNRPLAA